MDKYGYWAVPGKKFYNKYDALVYASAHNMPAKFVYHHDIWDNFDRTQLGTIPLNTLYKDRAQQLRDTYDYLILYYSGGADSHNVLRTFIDNNIKLDEVCVKWPKKLQEGNFYRPNTQDKSASNYWSEWDYSIKPILDQLAKDHPDINIKIQDFAGDIVNYRIDPLFEKLNFVRGIGGMLINSVVSDSEQFQLSKGKTVGHIYGVDKPLLTYNPGNGEVYMNFTDIAIDQVARSTLHDGTSECFYWTPEIPLLAFEQAYQVALFYERNKQARQYLWETNMTKIHTPQERMIKAQTQNDIARDVIYTTWDNRFQTDKPTSIIRTDKFNWIYRSSELENIKKNYFGILKERSVGIADKFVTKVDDSTKVYNLLTTVMYYVTTIKL